MTRRRNSPSRRSFERRLSERRGLVFVVALVERRTADRRVWDRRSPWDRRAGVERRRKAAKPAGFTVIELLIVMTIIGLVAAIAIPKLGNTKDRAQIAAMQSDLRNLVAAQENYFAENGQYATDLGAGYRVSAGNRMPVIKADRDGWTASMTSANGGHVCAVFIGRKPLPPATKEGSPACAKTGSATIQP